MRKVSAYTALSVYAYMLAYEQAPRQPYIRLHSQLLLFILFLHLGDYIKNNLFCYNNLSFSITTFIKMLSSHFGDCIKNNLFVFYYILFATQSFFRFENYNNYRF